MSRTGGLIRVCAMGWGLALSVPASAGAQILETETARPVGRGVLEVSSNFEYQTSSEGSETALPFAAEYGLTDRFELLLEPVAYTAIRPKAAASATGLGDLELTATYLVLRELGGAPALALAGEVKFPTAHNTLIGTGRTDYTGYLIASKRWGRFDVHGNIGYTIVGKPAGSQLNNIFNFALGSERTLGAQTELFGEVLADTASSSAPEPTGPLPPGTVAPEAPAGEVVGSLGIARYVLHGLRLSFGISVDNNGAVLFRPGVTLRTR